MLTSNAGKVVVDAGKDLGGREPTIQINFVATISLDDATDHKAI
jgi:hypothetical protein